MHICNCLLAFRFWETCPKKQNLDSKFLKDFSTTRNVKKNMIKALDLTFLILGMEKRRSNESNLIGFLFKFNQWKTGNGKHDEILRPLQNRKKQTCLYQSDHIIFWLDSLQLNCHLVTTSTMQQ